MPHRAHRHYVPPVRAWPVALRFGMLVCAAFLVVNAQNYTKKVSLAHDWYLKSFVV